MVSIVDGRVLALGARSVSLGPRALLPRAGARRFGLVLTLADLAGRDLRSVPGGIRRFGLRLGLFGNLGGTSNDRSSLQFCERVEDGFVREVKLAFGVEFADLLAYNDAHFHAQLPDRINEQRGDLLIRTTTRRGNVESNLQRGAVIIGGLVAFLQQEHE
eukprot:4517797-Prymnesium_polylepis.1